MEVKESHLVIRLVGGPMLLRHSVCGDHDTRAIIAEIAVHEYFLFWIVANQFEKSRDLVVGGAKEGAGGETDVTHAETLDDNPLGRVGLGVPQINNDVDAEIFQLLIPEVTGLRAAIQHVANPACIRNALHSQFFGECQDGARVGRRCDGVLRAAILQSEIAEQ